MVSPDLALSRLKRSAKVSILTPAGLTTLQLADSPPSKMLAAYISFADLLEQKLPDHEPAQTQSSPVNTHFTPRMALLQAIDRYPGWTPSATKSRRFDGPRAPILSVAQRLRVPVSMVEVVFDAPGTQQTMHHIANFRLSETARVISGGHYRKELKTVTLAAAVMRFCSDMPDELQKMLESRLTEVSITTDLANRATNPKYWSTLLTEPLWSNGPPHIFVTTLFAENIPNPAQLQQGFKGILTSFGLSVANGQTNTILRSTTGFTERGQSVPKALMAIHSVFGTQFRERRDGVLGTGDARIESDDPVAMPGVGLLPPELSQDL